MLAILNYEAGNLTSVRRALDSLGIPCTVTADHDVIARSQGIIFPGVGAAGSAMEHLRRFGMADAILREIGRNKPMLGICLGCQILLDHSPENDTRTLGVISGQCGMFTPDLSDENGEPINILGIIRYFFGNPVMSSNGFKPPDFIFILKSNTVHFIGTVCFKQRT